MELTLCTKCAADYAALLDHTVRRKNLLQTVREPCSICARNSGFDYIVESRKGVNHWNSETPSRPRSAR